jgi:CubicO group peptidase (beta-lactamase class C family)
MKQVFTLMFIFFYIAVPAQQYKLPADVKKSIQERIRYETNISIVVGVINEHGRYYFPFGHLWKNGPKADAHTIYEIGSVSKVFTSILLAEQVVKGNMHVDDTAQSYLPDSVLMPSYDKEVITLGHLTDHTSSLPRMPSNFSPKDPLNPYADYTVDLMYQFLNGLTLDRAIGSQFEYSNLAVGLLGHILSLHSGMSYEELLHNTITDPLQMKETAITLDENMHKNLARGYAGGEPMSNWDLPALAGAGAIRSSAHDMLSFLAANLNFTFTPLLPAMEMTHRQRHTKSRGSGVGMGWFIDQSFGTDVRWHNGATGGYRAFAGFSRDQKMGVVVLTNSDQDTDDIGYHLLFPDSPLRSVKPDMILVIREVIEKKGSNGLADQFDELKKKYGRDYDINEMSINALGYHYLRAGQPKAAIEIFKINVEEFPSSSNVYDSYGEALMEDGQTEDAITNYKKSLELNPGNTNAIEMLAKMGVEFESDDIVVGEALLDSYVGTYELVPGFNIVVTRDGSRLFGQATGQPQFEMFPKTESEFYLKVVEAKIIFSKNDSGEAMMTLYQSGQVLPGRKLK